MRGMKDSDWAHRATDAAAQASGLTSRLTLPLL